MQLDLDELWPDSASLVGLRFATPDAFARAQALLWEHLDLYRWVWEGSRTIAVRKADVELFKAAGLAYTEVEIQDDNTPLSAEEQAGYRQWRRETFRQFVERLRSEA
jgi:hypothetical protein